MKELRKRNTIIRVNEDLEVDASYKKTVITILDDFSLFSMLRFDESGFSWHAGEDLSIRIFFDCYLNGQIKKSMFYLEDKLVKTRYLSNGILEKREYFCCQENKLHRTDGPACVEYCELTKLYSVSYYFEGKLHRDDGPARIQYFSNGQVLQEEYYFQGELYRTDGPALIEYYDNGKIKLEMYYEKPGILHKEDGPAVVEYDRDGFIECEKFYIDSKEKGKKSE